MAIVLDHTIVSAKDKVVSAEFFAEIFGLTVKPGPGRFAQVQINEGLTFAFDEEPQPQDLPEGYSMKGWRNHYAFHISDAEFDAILGRVRAKGLPYGSGPRSHTDGEIYNRRGGRGFYFKDPNGHLLEVMTVPETGSS